MNIKQYLSVNRIRSLNSIRAVNGVRSTLPYLLVLATIISACAPAKPQTAEISFEASADRFTSSEQDGQSLAKAAPAENQVAVDTSLATKDDSRNQNLPADMQGIVQPDNGVGGSPIQAPDQVVEPEVQEPQNTQPGLITQPVEDVSNLPVGTKIGQVAPDFSLQTLDGQTMRLSDLRGRPVMISYWASWCDPCINEMQIMQRIYQQYQDQGFVILSINAIGQDSLAEVNGTVNQLGLTFPVLLDEGNAFADSYQALFFPTTFFVDVNGVIRDVALGDSPEAEFKARVEKFLAGDV